MARYMFCFCTHQLPAASTSSRYTIISDEVTGSDLLGLRSGGCQRWKNHARTAERVQHRKKSFVMVGGKFIIHFPSFYFLTSVKLHFHMSDLYVPHDWLWSCLSERRKVADKGAAELWRIAPTHLPQEQPLPSPSSPLEMATKCVFTPFALRQQDARWQMSRQYKKTFRACSDFLRSRLAFITPTLPSLHQRNSWCSCICESFILSERLLCWQKRRQWFHIRFCVYAQCMRRSGRYKWKVCLQTLIHYDTTEKKDSERFLESVKHIQIREIFLCRCLPLLFIIF